MDSSIKHLLSLGCENFSRNDYVAAEGPLRACLEAVPTLADVHFMLGVIHHDRGELVEARERFEQALALNPAYTDAALSLAVTCNELGRYAEGRAISQRISQQSRAQDRIDPFARGKLANLHAHVARAYEELGLYPEAAEEYERALGLCPGFADLRTRRAAALRASGEPDRALRELEVAVVQVPGYAPAHASLGVSLWSMGRRDEAQAAWRKALEIEPRNRAAKAYLRMAARDGTTPAGAPLSMSPEELEGIDVTLLDEG
ncbi:MAG: tetratricopeptide repeat protein [Polyangiales bacterium]